jgi:putative phosphoesterase
MFRVGVISDTHGLLRPQALEALAGAQHLIHAGDVGTPEVLAQLRVLAPITAVRGNNDVGEWAAALPLAVSFELEGLRLHLLHDVAELALAPVELGIRAVIAGHSHRPAIRNRGRRRRDRPLRSPL